VHPKDDLTYRRRKEIEREKGRNSYIQKEQIITKGMTKK
jgi:hypothetical protein